MASAVFTGTVDFSTTILEDVDTEAIIRAAPSQYVRSAALPAPTPRVLVGVFTLQRRRPGERVLSSKVAECESLPQNTASCLGDSAAVPSGWQKRSCTPVNWLCYWHIGSAGSRTGCGMQHHIT